MQNSPGANPILGGSRGGGAGPAGPPALTPCSPSGAGQGARHLPKGRCPPALLTSEDGVCGVEAMVVQNSPCSLHPLQKQASWGVCPPPSRSGPRDGGKHSGTTHSARWGGPGDPEEGTSSVNVTGMQTPVSQERRGCSLPESLAASGSQAEAGTGPTQPPAVSGELHSAREQVKTTSNQTHARQLFAHVSRRLPDALAAEFLSSLGRGGEKKNRYLYAGVPAVSALRRGLISLPPWSRWPSVLRWPAGRRRLASLRAAPARPESTCSAAARAAKPWARRG